MNEQSQTFREKLLEGRFLFGSFMKIAHTMPTEVLGSLNYDFVVIDEEHAPINRESTDRILLACKAHGMGGLVRVQNGDASTILSVIDCGADGVLVPHVDSAAKAREIVSAARYRSGLRGYSATTRAGNFGSRTIEAHLDQQDASIAVIAMIEDPHALDQLDEILAVKGLDAVFIGRGDLTVAYGETKAGSAPVKAASRKIAGAARAAGKPICVMTGGAADAGELAELGATAFIVSSDQTFLRNAAASALSAVRETVTR
ncbi:HpcH/HpaI aldolase family protein [Hoeflea sp.]|uniref:HpcH/HpaI aldolase family protein n=1 Tax=Hoeflea sp. TaxID=1940281 RepID=UPI003A924A78